MENAVEFYGAISHNKLHGLPIKLNAKETHHLPAVVDGYASEGIVQFFFENTDDGKGFNIYVLDEANRVEIYSHCEGSKEELVRDVSRFYSSSHDRFTYGANFINFNLPQFYQIIKNNGHNQVIPFAGGAWALVTEQVNSDDGRLNKHYSDVCSMHN